MIEKDIQTLHFPLINSDDILCFVFQDKQVSRNQSGLICFFIEGRKFLPDQSTEETQGSLKNLTASAQQWGIWSLDNAQLPCHKINFTTSISTSQCEPHMFIKRFILQNEWHIVASQCVYFK